MKTAIICSPDIHCPGRGPGKMQSEYVPVFLNEIKQLGAAFYAGEGTDIRPLVDIEDLITVHLKLVEAPVAGSGCADQGKEVRLPIPPMIIPTRE